MVYPGDVREHTVLFLAEDMMMMLTLDMVCKLILLFSIDTC